MALLDELKSEKVGVLADPTPLVLAPETSVEEAVAAMRRSGGGCALVAHDAHDAHGKRLVGIFTERDLLFRVVAQARKPSIKVSEVMTPNPDSLAPDDHLGLAIRHMTEGGHRNLPLTDPQGRILGLLTVKQVIDYLAEHFPENVLNLPPRPGQAARTVDGG